MCVCDVGFDGSGKIEWQNFLGEAAEAAISGIRVVAADAQPPRRASKYARKMGETHHQAAASSRLGISDTVGEIVEVQGGHIFRSTGRKDRHSKVCTAKGPRDRRVRLSAHTAIQFYDLQDRLGYDRPSKAVDWLIKKAKASIDELAELPPWDPTTAGFTPKTSITATRSTRQQNISDEEYGLSVENVATSKTAAIAEVQNMQQQMAENLNSSSGFLPPSLDSDVTADTIKTFFPTGSSTETSSPTIRFQNYPPYLPSRTSSQNQDLRLSLLSFQEPILLQHQAHHHGHQAQSEHQVLFSGTTAHYLGFDYSFGGWSEQQQPPEITRFQRNPVAWNAGNVGGGGGGSAGLIFNASLLPTQTMPSSPLVQPHFGQNQFFSQRGTLQSSNTPSFRAWTDPAINLDHLQQQQTAISGNGFTASDGGFSGFRVPARVQGEEEECNGIHNKPSSASSDSRRRVHCLRQSTMRLRIYFQDWLEGWDSGRLEMNQSQIPWEKREIRIEFQDRKLEKKWRLHDLLSGELCFLVSVTP
ncbi:hypothetical protein SADUNF_Sadunf11G0065600 [Salix dunnii]|uniref:TCP domain-containing protein n=1 Tax=Salix dunnii TaxID=1413687 RepID=A0A835JTD9_9ROSI|nr:hypothetical protein SADUNF_Sadunf11G0065600 [Salix dunnii]